MNHLAHLLLSQSDPELMVGNFIADHVKGKKILDYNSGIQSGIKMHRAIDAFTDHHEMVKRSKERLYPTYRKYAAVIVDMYFDHLLAKNWKLFSPIQLSSFSSSVYRLLNAQKANLPETSKRFLFYMEQGDWLTNYSTLGGIGQALSGLARRATFESKMEKAVYDLERDYDLYWADFESFFPELFEFSMKWINDNE